MAHLIDSMAYTGETPWHGLGATLTDPSDVDLCLKEAGLDWTVRLEQAYWRTPEGKGRKVPDTFFVMGKEDHCFQTVSNRYAPIQNKDIVEMFREYCDKGHLRMETLGSLAGGNIIWALAKYGDDYKIGNDIHQSYCNLSTSHDGSLSFQGQMTNVRVVCNNTRKMMMRDGNTKKKVKHTTNWQNGAKGIKDLLKIQDATVQADRMKLEQYFDTRVTRSEIPVVVDLVTRFAGKDLLRAITEVSAVEVSKDNLLDVMIDRTIADHEMRKTVGSLSDMNRLGKSILDTWLNDKTMGDNKTSAYGVINAVTRELDHNAGHNADSRLKSAWYGNYAKIKEQTESILDLIVQAA